MASPTPTADIVNEYIGRAFGLAARARALRGGYRRRSDPGDPRRREELEDMLTRLKAISEILRRERIRAARDKRFGRLYGNRLADASAAVKRERYATYRMLNPGGHKWTR